MANIIGKIGGGNKIVGKISGMSNAAVEAELALKADKAETGARLDATDAQLADIDGRIDTLITTPVPVGEIIAQEIIDARQGALSVGANITEVKSQLAQSVQQIQYTKFGRNTKQPLVTFVDDDAGTTHIMSKLKPLYDAKGIVGVTAVNGDPADKIQDLLTLQNAGWEIASHSFAHVVLTTLTEEQLRADFEASKSILKQSGLNVENIVYPHGTSNPLVRKVAKDYFNCGVRVGGGINNYPFNQFDLNRVALGSSFDSGSPIGGFATNTLEYYKYRVDQAIANNCWLIFMTHAWDGALDATQLQHISDLIDYIQSKNVDVVTLKKGLELIGNVVENGDAVAGGDYLTVDCEGKVYSPSIFNVVKNEKPNFALSTTPITSFLTGKITVTAINSLNATGFPNDERGILITHKSYAENGYPYQEYHIYNLNRIYRRQVKADGTWSEWTQNQIKLPYKTVGVLIGTVNAQSTKEISVPYDGVVVGDACIVNYFGSLGPGIMISANISSANIITLIAANVTNANVFVDTRTINFTVLKR